MRNRLLMIHTWELTEEFYKHLYILIMSYSKISFLFFLKYFISKGKTTRARVSTTDAPEFRWVTQYWEEWKWKMKWLHVLKIRFAVYWVFKNSHGGKALTCASRDLSRGPGPHGTMAVDRPHTLCFSVSLVETWTVTCPPIPCAPWCVNFDLSASFSDELLSPRQ